MVDLKESLLQEIRLLFNGGSQSPKYNHKELKSYFSMAFYFLMSW